MYKARQKEATYGLLTQFSSFIFGIFSKWRVFSVTITISFAIDVAPIKISASSTNFPALRMHHLNISEHF